MINIALAAAILTQILDGVSTYRALRRGGVHEGNPVMSWLMNLIGIAPALVLTKGLIIELLVLAWAHGYETALWVIAAGYVAVVANNLYLGRKHR